MVEKEVLQVVADKAADDLHGMSAFALGLTAHPTELKDAERTNTKGHRFHCGTLRVGRRTYSFEVWLDRFVSFASDKAKTPHLWYGIFAGSENSLDLIVEHLPKHLQPVHELRPADLVWDEAGGHVTKIFPLGYDGKVIRERHYSGMHYLGIYNAYLGLSKASLRMMGAKAAEFWRYVLGAVHDMTLVDEIILEGQEVTRSTAARTRSAKLRAYALKHFRPLRCEVCKFSTPRLEALKNREIIEFHHKKPISWNDVNGTKQLLSSALASLVPLCPTCHRIAHSTFPGRGKLFSVAEIRKSRKGEMKWPPTGS